MNAGRAVAPPGAGAARRGLVAPSPTLWGTIRHELLFLGYALMEIALATPVVLVILSWARYWPPYEVALWLLLVMLLPLNLIRLMSLLRIDVKWQRRILVVALLLTILVSWRLLLYPAGTLLDLSWLRLFTGSFGEGGSLLWTRDLSVFLVTALAWWRGIRLAVRHVEINNVGLRLRLGGLILWPLILWFAGSFLEVNVAPFVLLFFLAALTVVALVRAENIEQERSGTAATLNVRWFLVVLAAALVIVVTGGATGAIIGGESLYVFIGWLSPLWRALQFGATVTGVTLFELLYPILEMTAGFVQFLSRILAGILGLVSAGLRASGILNEPLVPEVLPPTETPGFVMPEGSDKAITAFIMLGLIALVGLALARAYRQATFAARNSARSQTMSPDEDDEPGLGQRVLERLGLLRQWRAAASVRRIYRQMCRAAESAGYPRLATETPYEYLPTLGRVWPEQAAESRLITEAFIRVRYGELPETEEELDAIRAAWRRLEEAEPQRRETAAGDGPRLTKME